MNKMKFLLLFLIMIGLRFSSPAQSDSLFIRKIYDEALERGEAYPNLRYLCKQIGHRLSGSTGAEKAVIWSKGLMESYGFDSVYLQEIMVPKWVRGNEEEAFIKDRDGQIIGLNLLALGGSEGTSGWIEAEVIRFEDVESLKKAHPDEVKGKIVFLTQAFDQKLLNTFAAYGACGNMRWSGAAEASKKGAVAVVIRSLGSEEDDHPHTGSRLEYQFLR
jgi:hypothetical protein